ncbi:MAG: hypothetical protein M1814_004042 [Vezdaea aestivalis]|nr:MAG: hypothetical protein M1814_004042 [Vezdaea aestivalis]
MVAGHLRICILCQHQIRPARWPRPSIAFEIPQSLALSSRFSLVTTPRKSYLGSERAGTRKSSRATWQRVWLRKNSTRSGDPIVASEHSAPYARFTKVVQQDLADDWKRSRKARGADISREATHDSGTRRAQFSHPSTDSWRQGTRQAVSDHSGDWMARRTAGAYRRIDNSTSRGQVVSDALDDWRGSRTARGADRINTLASRSILPPRENRPFNQGGEYWAPDRPPSGERWPQSASSSQSLNPNSSSKSLYVPAIGTTPLINTSKTGQSTEELSPENGDAYQASGEQQYDNAPVVSAGLDSRMQQKIRGKEKDRARRKDRFVASYDEQAEQNRQKEKLANAKVAKRMARRQMKKQEPTPIELPDFISVGRLAQLLHVHTNDFNYKMSQLGFDSWNSDLVLGAETAGLIAMEYNFEPLYMAKSDEDIKAQPLPTDKSSLPVRPPIVTIMGHVDHGKTTLLDYLRKSSVVASEHGGITQHIGAFSVKMPSGNNITFLDTPGHAAFLSMRQRGANVTDIVVLVVAADDSVKPQTLEALKHVSAAGVPMIVAINKIDKEGANADKVKRDLLSHGVELEDVGGDTQVILVSGKTGQGLNELDDALVALSELLDKRAPVDGPPEGWVIEATTKAEGRAATILVRRGTLRIGDLIVAGSTWARARALRNQSGEFVEEVGPGIPVEVHGWREQPVAGDEVLSADDEAHAKRVVEFRTTRTEKLKLVVDTEAINEFRHAAKQAESERKEREKEHRKAMGWRGRARCEPLAKVDDGGPLRLSFVIKGDVSGSVEAVTESISSIGNDEVKADILRSGVGPVSEFDIEHAAAAKGHVISFNMDIDPQMRQFADYAKVKIYDHNVIYRLVDDVRNSVSALLTPIVKKKVLSETEIAQIFDVNIKGRKFRSIAGCKVRNGILKRSDKAQVLRDGSIVFEGKIDTLKNVKKDVEEMRKGTECGLAFEGWEGMQVGDRIQTIEEFSEARSL